MEHYITSYVILPHGITDLTRITLHQLPYLLIIYFLGLTSCAIFHEIVQYGHLYLFLVASVIHFTYDFIALKKSLCLSVLSSSAVVLTPLVLLQNQMLWFAKVFMIIYMVCFHVPLHYHRLKLKRRDIIPILGCTAVFGIYGPQILSSVEDNGAEGMESVMVCGLVVGHVSWNM